MRFLPPFPFRAAGALACLGLSSCALFPSARPGAAPPAPGDDSAAQSAGQPAATLPEEETFHYCPVETVRQSSPQGGGIASLASVIRYWDSEVVEDELAKRYPPEEADGYTMMQLRRIAVDEGLMAFSITMKLRPMDQLGEQLEHGRPVVVSLRFPDGTYFGNDSEIIETLAREEQGRRIPAIKAAMPYYFVVFGQSEQQLLLMDPQLGIVSVDKPVFTQYWKEEKFAALLCSAE